MSPRAGEPRAGAGKGRGSARMLGVHGQEDLKPQGGRTSGAQLEDGAWAEAGEDPRGVIATVTVLICADTRHPPSPSQVTPRGRGAATLRPQPWYP